MRRYKWTLFCGVSIPCQMVSQVVVPSTGLVFLQFMLAVVGAFYYFIHFTESTMWLFHRLQCNVAGITMT